jgi:thiol-disulfide isomerase/thioredoxin/sugar lactone lactonase YvrE
MIEEPAYAEKPRPYRPMQRRILIAVLVPLAGLAAPYGASRWLSHERRSMAAEKRMRADSIVPVEDEVPTYRLVTANRAEKAQEDPRAPAPELDGGVAWLNTASPIHLRDLRGKIVLLDFWTFCCINCIHTLPDLARLEKKYAKQLVVIGVHSAKFDSEKSTENIRKAILRYEISHPVVNDANMKIWQAYGVSSWPTLFLLDPEGNIVGRGSGEGLGDTVDDRIAKLIQEYRGKKTLNEEPLRFDLARGRERGDTPLFFPGKVLADGVGGRLFIADSTHHRIVLTDLAGRNCLVAGTGRPGRSDGPFDRATFNDPQGLALRGDILYVADRKNHLIRALDLAKQTVTTIAGNGEKGEDRRQAGPALGIGLNSPWDLYLHGNSMYIAMAGHHQIWMLDLQRKLLAPYAGSGRENILDGPLMEACFAQPSGLAGNGTTLFVADSEVSAIRAVPLGSKKGEVQTLVGEGLFEFGDRDGIGEQVRLQHALGVTYHQGKLFVADTYNDMIKSLDPRTRSCTAFVGRKAEGWLASSPFNQPGGLSIAGDKLYVADTNNHRIRIVDLNTKAISTLELHGLEAPKLAQGRVQ